MPIRHQSTHHDDETSHAPAIAPGRSTLTAGLARSSPAHERTSGARELDPGASDRLPPAVGASMGASFGLDLSNVPVTTNSAAATDVGARAMATRGQLHFAPGEYDPSSTAGLELIGHEVAHLSQQADGRAAKGAHAKGVDLGDSPALEAEADDLGRRAARGEPGLSSNGGVLRTPLTSATAVQRKQTKWEDIGENNRGVIWDPHRTRIDPTGQSMGTGAAIDGAGPVPASVIAYSGLGNVDMPRKIAAGGLGVDASVLGPNHPDGAKAPAWGTPVALDAIAAQVASAASVAAPAKYEARQLLPGALGGEGTPRNLVAVPPQVAAVLDDLHARADRLVHGARTFIKYLVRVTEAADAGAAGAPYVSRIELSWSQVKNDGGAIADATGTVHVDVPSPSQHAGATTATVARPLQNPGTTDANQALQPVGATAKHAQARADFTTHISFGASHATRDGTKMEAHRLGPDHKVGDEPDSGGVWGARTRALQAASGNKKTYVAGHLLNHHLGGPGNDERNLAAIPADANDLHESQVESVIKSLVNEQGAWVYYKVDVTHAHDAGPNVDYPSAFACTWHQLDGNGAPVPGTAGAKTINIAAPSTYASAAPPPKKKEASLATTTVNTVDLSDGHADGATVRTSLNFDEVLLEDRATLKHQIAVVQPLVARLKKLGLEPAFAQNGALAADLKVLLAAYKPAVDESKAASDVEVLSEQLNHRFDPSEIPVKELQIDELEAALKVLTGATSARHKTTASTMLVFFAKHFVEPKAKDIAEAVDGQMRMDVHVMTKIVEAAKSTIGFARFTIQELQSNRRAFAAVDRSMSSWSGRPPSHVDASPDQMRDNTMQSVSTGVGRVVDAAEPSLPRSPMQTIGVAEHETGGTFDDSLTATSALAQRRGDLDRPQPASSTPAPRRGADELFDLAKVHASKWPKWKGGVSDVDPVAIAIETLVNGLPATGAALPVTIQSLYVTNTRAVVAYLDWVKSQLG